MCMRMHFFMEEIMRILKRITEYFTAVELILWSSSVLLTVASFCIFGSGDYLTLAASLIGVTSLIFAAKGNPVSQILMIIFSLIYGVISWGFRYYGEMITYLGMTMPMSAFALVSWLRNPYKGRKSEVAVNRISRKEQVFMWALTAAVTAVFYFILSAFNTANIIPGTVSVTTSFAAVYLTFRRSPYFALAYAANDIVLMVLWIMASFENTAYISVTVCFAAFFANDIYGFISWRKMEKRQRENQNSVS